MFYCNKCKKEIIHKKDLYKGLCEKCYKEYLLKKIENLDNPNYTSNIKNNFTLKNFFKKLLKKRINQILRFCIICIFIL